MPPRLVPAESAGVHAKLRGAQREPVGAIQSEMERLVKILEPISIGTLQLKNRIMVPPHAVVYAGPAGEVTQRQIDYVVERAKAGAAIVSTEDTSVAPGYGMWGTQAQRIDSDDRIPMYRELTDAVRAAGAKSTIQLNVALWGAIRDTLAGKQPVSASEIP